MATTAVKQLWHRRSEKGIFFGLAFLLIFFVIALAALTLLVQTGSAIYYHQKLVQAEQVTLASRFNPYVLPGGAGANDPTAAANDALTAMGITAGFSTIPIVSAGAFTYSHTYPPMRPDNFITMQDVTFRSVMGTPLKLSATTTLPVGTPIGHVLFFGANGPTPSTDFNIWCTEVQPPPIGSIPDGSWMFMWNPTGVPLACLGGFTGAGYDQSGKVFGNANTLPVGTGDP